MFATEQKHCPASYDNADVLACLLQPEAWKPREKFTRHKVNTEVLLQGN